MGASVVTRVDVLIATEEAKVKTLPSLRATLR